ncbi:radical SAM protein [Candidatus Gracilibacteria bacterium]|nr:radical SAM protein [Candidatus Gracilibacteria bacterium]
MQKNKPFDIFTLQRHITNNCQLRCKHCYVDFSKPVSINMSDFHKALDNYKRFLSYFGIKGKIYYTGGDPFLHQNFWDIILHTKKNNIDVSIFGNYHFLNDVNINRLYKNGIKFYQLSIEGLEKVHDQIRGTGTFNGVIDAINRLEKRGIYTLVNMTLSKLNIDQLIPLIKFLAYNTNLSRFDFVRVIPIGKAKDNITLNDNDFKNILLDVLNIENKIKEDGKKLTIGKKDHLRSLLYFQANRLKIDINDKVNGCGMVYRHLSIIENGDIYVCRKLPIKVGNIIKDDLIDIYKNNKIVSQILEMNFVNGCKGCELNNICRGCPAVTYGYYGNLLKKDPQCWV